MNQTRAFIGADREQGWLAASIVEQTHESFVVNHLYSSVWPPTPD
ncbi:MAG TPA: hypothetical protein VEH04_03055 [Verrucomicrobiae bacterium]|nr:hypothetical protein [Verrucomicrobiae bacterium]